MHPRRPAVPHRNVRHSWAPSSIFAAFNVVLLITISGLFFSFPCRWLAQHGDWVSPTITGFLFVPTVVSLIFLNFSDPGILHRGSEWQCPLAIKVVWVNRRAFRLQWCQRCCYHRPPRTYHCPWCNICVEDFDHHCKWVNNCIGQRNFRCFMLLVVSLCLYTGSLLSSCLAFLIRTSQQPFSVDKAFAIVVALPAAAFLLPLLLLLGMQALSVSSAERSYEVKCRYLQGYNPFDQGCASNWYLTFCVPLGPKYMAEAIRLQRVVGPDKVPISRLCSPQWHTAPCPFPVPYSHSASASCSYAISMPTLQSTGGMPGLRPTTMPRPHPANALNSHSVPGLAPPHFPMKPWRSGRSPLGGGEAAPQQKTQLALCHYATSYEEENFPMAKDFKPECWLRKGNMDRVDNFGSIPFGYGLRSCIGRRISELEIHLVMILLLQHFEIKTSPLTKTVHAKTHGLLTPGESINVRFVTRK